MRRLPAILMIACAHAAPIGSRPGFAVNKASAAEVCLPEGELDYLKSLRCPSGDRPRFHRIGSVGSRNPAEANDPRLLQQMDISGVLGPGDPDLHIVDAYELRCGEKAFTVYLDMYHCARRVEQPAPDGFTRFATGT
jgi:hypothetical protein